MFYNSVFGNNNLCKILIIKILIDTYSYKIWCLFSELVNALIDAVYDKKADVRTGMKCSLQNLGLKQPELVLTSCNVYLSKHQKVRFDYQI